MARVVLAGYLLRVKGCGFRSVRYLESQNYSKGPVRSKRSSVIGNWEVVRSSEVCNALNLMPNSIGATGFVRYIEAVRSWEGPLWEVLLYTTCSVPHEIVRSNQIRTRNFKLHNDMTTVAAIHTSTV